MTALTDSFEDHPVIGFLSQTTIGEPLLFFPNTHELLATEKETTTNFVGTETDKKHAAAQIQPWYESDYFDTYNT